MSSSAKPAQRHLLLAVPMRKGKQEDLDPITQYVRDTFGPEQARDAEDDVETIQQLRDAVVREAASMESLKSTLPKYYHALQAIDARFPFASSRSALHDISFSWSESFNSKNRNDAGDLLVEKASVLFNLGAVLSKLAQEQDRSEPEGVARACQLLQEAAGTFQALREHDATRLDSPAPDLTQEALTFLERLALAQAQQCCFERAATDGKSHQLCARLALHAAELFSSATRAAERPPLSSYLDVSWPAHSRCKDSMYRAYAELCMARHHREKDENTSELARLREAHRLMATARHVASRGLSHDTKLENALLMLEEDVNAALNKAERENNTVYLARIPEHSTLPEIQPAPLVRAIQPDLKPREAQDYFRNIVPESATRAVSKYTDMVDRAVRDTLDALAEASDEARAKLRLWDLPDALLALRSGEEGGASATSLPDALREDLIRIESRGGLRMLQELQEQSGQLRKVAASDLERVTDLLDKEEADDNAIRHKVGSAVWTRKPSAALNAPYRQQLDQYRGHLGKAQAADDKVARQLAAEQGMLRALTVDDAVAMLPRLEAPMVPVSEVAPADAAHVLRALLQQQEDVSASLAALEREIKDLKARDDILPRLLAEGVDADQDAFFAREIEKYAALRQRCAAAAAAQAQLLQRIERAQAQFKEAFAYDAWTRQCARAAESFREACKSWSALRDDLDEGIKFYTRLQDALRSLSRSVGDFVMTRRIERDDQLARLRREGGQAAANVGGIASQLAQTSLAAARDNAPGPPPTFPPQPHHYPQQQYAQPQPPHGAAPGGYPPPQYAQGYGHPQQGGAQGFDPFASHGHVQPGPHQQWGSGGR
ncbi:unnamed protein product [Pedinophyceae sp. YPF-701]|nr:unnamed protein product [Pedinophyceae sp. YPF-701]